MTGECPGTVPVTFSSDILGLPRIFGAPFSGLVVAVVCVREYSSTRRCTAGLGGGCSCLRRVLTSSRPLAGGGSPPLPWGEAAEVRDPYQQTCLLWDKRHEECRVGVSPRWQPSALLIPNGPPGERGRPSRCHPTTPQIQVHPSSSEAPGPLGLLLKSRHCGNKDSFWHRGVWNRWVAMSQGEGSPGPRKGGCSED